MDKPLAIVTGAGSGIGRELSNNLKTFYEVIRITKDNYSAEDWIFQCDVGRKKDVEYLAEILNPIMKDGVKLLVNCAAVNRIEFLENLSVEDWDECYSSNVRSVFLMSKHFLSSLSKAKGIICNIGSIAGKQPMRATLPYCSSKAALTMMTRQMARELYDRYNVSVFEFSIGARVQGTGMTEYVRQQVCKVRGWKEEEYDSRDEGLKMSVEEISSLMMEWLKDFDKLWMLNGSIVEIGG